MYEPSVRYLQWLQVTVTAWVLPCKAVAWLLVDWGGLLTWEALPGKSSLIPAQGKTRTGNGAEMLTALLMPRWVRTRDGISLRPGAVNKQRCLLVWVSKNVFLGLNYAMTETTTHICTLRGNEQKHLSLSCSVHCLSTTLSLLFSSLATNNIKVERWNISTHCLS